MSSLYVKREYQKKGLGGKLLHHFEKQVPSGSIIFIKVLNNAPWAKNFYCKNGYLPLNNETREIANSLKIIEKSWSTIFYKKRL